MFEYFLWNFSGSWAFGIEGLSNSLFWIPSRRPAKRTGCHAGKGAEPRAVPNLLVKNANAKGVRIIGSPSILRWSGRASHLKTTKNHQTQGQCRISWDRKQSLLVDPIRAPTRDNASRLGGLAPRELRTLKPDATRRYQPHARRLSKRRRSHGNALDAHDKVASYVGKEAGPSRIGMGHARSDMFHMFSMLPDNQRPVK